MTDKESHWLIRGIKRKQLRKEWRKALRKADKVLGIKNYGTDYDPYDFCGSICPVCEDIINRQKSEIESLERQIETLSNNPTIAVTFNNGQTEEISGYIEFQVKKIKAEAVKEFAEKLKEHYCEYDDYDDIYARHIRDDIDFLVEEMVGSK